MRYYPITLLAACLLSPMASASIAVFSDQGAFNQALSDSQSVSFNSYPVGFYPATSLQLGSVAVVLTNAGSAPIFGPGLFGFTTNFLSTGVSDTDNNVVITLPTGAVAGGMVLASVYPVTLTAKSPSGELKTITFSSSTGAFLGFHSPSGIETITVSSQSPTTNTPIVNIGIIAYGSMLASPIANVPTMTHVGAIAFILGLLLSAGVVLRRHSSAA